MRHTLLSGEIIEVPVLADEVGAFLRRVLVAAEDPTVTELDLSGLVHGGENPLLDMGVVPGRPVATVNVYRDPAFHVMLDCIARKRLQRRAGSARPTMSVADAARQLGISESAVRQAIYADRLRARKEGGTYFIDPESVAELRVGRRGPRRREPMSSRSGGELDVRVGADDEVSLHVKHPQQTIELEDEPGTEWMGALPTGWSRVGVLGTLRHRAWFWVIEPAGGTNVLDFEGFFVRGGFLVVDAVCSAARGKAAFGAFVPK